MPNTPPWIRLAVTEALDAISQLEVQLDELKDHLSELDTMIAVCEPLSSGKRNAPTEIAAPPQAETQFERDDRFASQVANQITNE